MKIQQLGELLKPWLVVDTWNTYHALDEQRFHKALNNAFNHLGAQFDKEDFSDAMNQVIDEVYPNFDTDYKNELIADFSTRAENIANFVNDLN